MLMACVIGNKFAHYLLRNAGKAHTPNDSEMLDISESIEFPLQTKVNLFRMDATHCIIMGDPENVQITLQAWLPIYYATDLRIYSN